MKKYLYGILVMILAVSFVGVDAKSNTIYLKECEYTEEYKHWLTLSKKERDKTLPPKMCKNLSADKFTLVGNSSSNLVGGSINDDRFDLRDYGFVTSVKDQGETNSCWAFATNASIESNLLVNSKGTYDLSEAHLEMATQNTHQYNRLTFAREVNAGGNSFLASAYLRNNWGPVLETTVPFNKLVDLFENKTMIDESLILNNTGVLDVNSVAMLGGSEYGACSVSDIHDIKEYLITNGALTATVYFGNNYSYNLYQFYDGKAFVNSQDKYVPAVSMPNHAITIVGWDDTIDKNNFKTSTKPTTNGAFIIKNSYGVKQELIGLTEYKQDLYAANQDFFEDQGVHSASDIPDDFAITNLKGVLKVDGDQIKVESGKIFLYIGDGGYQYVSYEDVFICANPIGFFDVDTEVEENVYGYDDLGINGTYSTGWKKVYMASIFDRKTNKTEELKELNVYFDDIGQEYKVYFANRATNQISDAAVVATGKSQFVGYHTINISDSLITGDRFSVIVEISSDTDVVIGASGKIPLTLWGDSQIVPEVQFISSDGITYSDVTNTDRTPFHLLIKAYTNEYEGNNETIPDDEPSGLVPPENEEITPPENEEITPPEEDDSESDNINNDGKIEILPNDMNNKLPENNNSDNEENPSTGNMESAVLIVSFIVLIIAFISYKKLQRVKHNN